MTEKQFEEYRNLRQERDTYRELLSYLNEDRVYLEAKSIDRNNSKSYPIGNDLKALLETFFQEKLKEITQQMEAL